MNRVPKAAPAHRLEGGLTDEGALDEPLPNAEQLVSDAIALASALTWEILSG